MGRIRKPPIYQRPAGYLNSPRREILEYTYDVYLMLICNDHRTGETKIHRREWKTKRGWHPFKPWELEEKDKLKLIEPLHVRGYWAPSTIALFLHIPFETVNRQLGY